MAGELNCEVYNHPEVLKAFTEAHERGVKIQIIAGPILSTLEDQETKLIDLVEKGIIELYYRPERHEQPHYRVVDNKNIYTEKSHSPLTSGEVIKLEDPKFWAEKLGSDFDVYIEEKMVKLSKTPKEDFLVLPPVKIRHIYNLASQLSKNYNFLTRPELEELLQTSVSN